MHQAKKYECGKVGGRGLLAAKRKELQLLTVTCLSLITFKFKMPNTQLFSPSLKEKAEHLKLRQVKSLILKPKVA